ncbi:MAG: arsenic resistance protein [Candidatus Thorarchaeota archaeon]
MQEEKLNRIQEVLEEKGKGIGFFEKFLPLWVALCILMGILISQIFPGISNLINSIKIGEISVPIGICLFLMMYPAMLNL